MANLKPILDPCCGSKMFYFDKNDPRVVFGDIRDESHTLCDNRRLDIKPDHLMDFTSLPYQPNTFSLVVFDPPHLVSAGKGWQALKYGKLNKSWRQDLAQGFCECFRVLKTQGVLIFKWSEVQIPIKDILSLTDQKPVFGHKSGKQAKTHWVCFLKG